MIIKMILLGLACLTANIMMANGDHKAAKCMNNFNWNDIQGTWYKLVASPFVLEFLNHYIFYFDVRDNKVKINGTAQQLPEDGGQTVSFDGEFEINKENQGSTLTPGFSKTMEMFNGTYTVVCNDPTCFFILKGQPDSISEETLGMYYSDKNPTQECKEKSFKAFEELGYTPDQVKEDETFSG